MRVLHLTHDEFDVLFDILRDTVDVIEGDLITTEDDNGNEVLEDISEYEAYKIYQKLISLRETNKRGEYNKLSEITPERGAKAVENNTSNATNSPSPVVANFPNIIWPDCSPPRLNLFFCIFSLTYLSPTLALINLIFFSLK